MDVHHICNVVRLGGANKPWNGLQFWNSGRFQRSLAPVVIVAVYTVLSRRLLPGVKVAISPVVSRATVPATALGPISVKVEVLMVAGFICLLKVAVTL